MKILQLISGFILMLYSLIILSFEVSIVSSSPKMDFFKKISYSLIFLSFICSFMLLFSYYLDKKRKRYQRLERNLVLLLKLSNFKIQLSELAAKSSVRIKDVNSFLKQRSRLKDTDLSYDNKTVQFSLFTKNKGKKVR